MALDLSNLSVDDAIAALKSYPRRYRAALLPIDGDDQAHALLTRPGPEGESALQVVDETAAGLIELRDALKQVLVHDDPELSATVLRHHGHSLSPPTSIGTALEQLGGAAVALADDLGHVGADDWNRCGEIAGTGETITALDLVREAVRRGSANLRRAEAALAGARSA